MELWDSKYPLKAVLAILFVQRIFDLEENSDLLCQMLDGFTARSITYLIEPFGIEFGDKFADFRAIVRELVECLCEIISSRTNHVAKDVLPRNHFLVGVTQRYVCSHILTLVNHVVHHLHYG